MNHYEILHEIMREQFFVRVRLSFLYRLLIKFLSEAGDFFFIGLAMGSLDARRRRALKNGGVKKKFLASEVIHSCILSN